MSIRHTGTVKWFNESKGFGFILPDDTSINNGKDVFLHVTAIKASGLRDLTEGDKVEFSLQERQGRVAAADLALSETVAA